MSDSDVDRRSFLKAAGVAAIGTVFPLSALAQEKASSSAPRVAVAISKEHSGKTSEVPSDVVTRMVNEAVISVTGAKNAAAGWKSLFKPSDKVAVKVNMLAVPALSTHVVVTEAVVAGILAAGVAPGQIVVFDRSEKELRRGGYKVSSDQSGVRYVGTDSPGVGYTDDIVTSGSVGSLMSRVVTDFATAIVNVPVLKDHDLCGVSLGMKNFFGVIHNPNKYHDNGCDPYVADLCASPLIRDRLRLVVIDGLIAQADGGPAYWSPGASKYAGVIVGTDPVATDRVGWDEIEAIRKGMGAKPLSEVGRKPQHIFTACEKGLGIADRSKIDVTRLTI